MPMGAMVGAYGNPQAGMMPPQGMQGMPPQGMQGMPPGMMMTPQGMVCTSSLLPLSLFFICLFIENHE